MKRRIGIIAAWRPEISAFESRFPPTEQSTIGAWLFNIHRDRELEVVYVVCGVGKVYCASCTQLLISQFSPNELYMTGICGGLGTELAGLSLVVPEKTLQHDVQSPGSGSDPWDLYNGRSAACIPDPTLTQSFREFMLSTKVPVHYGVVVSGDQRIRSTKQSEFLQSEFSAIAVDQEIAAFACVATLNNIPFMCLKAVSDKADDQTAADQQLYKMRACDLAAETLIDFLTNG